MNRIGMIGLNPGNGHPYSFSAVFNGFDPEALARLCEFELIRKYLRDFHSNREYIPDVRVTHIWTQSREASEKVAAVSRIPNIAASPEELIDSVDAVIFARDDVWNHWSMARKIFDSGKPVFLDKLWSPDPAEMELFSEVAKNYPLMTSGSFRWSPLTTQSKEVVKQERPATVYGATGCVWERYAPHLLEPLFHLLGHDVVSVQNAGREKADTVILSFSDGLQAVLQVFERLSLPLELVFRFRNGRAPYTLPYTDPTLENYFLSIVEMMRAFRTMMKTGVTPTPREETLLLNKVVIAALRSRQANGTKINIKEF